jgi:hypothetical protein
MWSAFYDERIGLSFAIVIGSRHAVIPGFKSRETHDRILLSEFQDSPKLEGQVTREQSGLQALFFFIDSCDWQG